MPTAVNQNPRDFAWPLVDPPKLEILLKTSSTCSGYRFMITFCTISSLKSWNLSFSFLMCPFFLNKSWLISSGLTQRFMLQIFPKRYWIHLHASIISAQHLHSTKFVWGKPQLFQKEQQYVNFLNCSFSTFDYLKISENKILNRDPFSCPQVCAFSLF